MSPKMLWMRGSVSFVALRELLCYIAQYPGGVRPKEIEIWAREKVRLRTRGDKPVSKTTIYHYRNTLLHLGIAQVYEGRYTVARDNPFVSDLLPVLQPGEPELSLKEREAFAHFVVRNPDCQQHFFDLFMPEDVSTYDLNTFLEKGQPVAWKRLNTSQGRFEQLYNLVQREKLRWICSEDEQQAILYGVRYWARNELGFLEEIFLEDVGGVMFPVALSGPVPDSRILAALQEAISPDQEWTVFSLRQIASTWGPEYRIPLKRLYGTLRWVYYQYPQYVVPIPTAEALATITAASPQAESYHLHGYFQDEKGRYVSHIRIHRSLREVILWSETLPA